MIESVPDTKKPVTTHSAALPVFLAISLLFPGDGRPTTQRFDTVPVGEKTQGETNAAASLEVRLPSPPRWQQGCLLVTLDRLNHSSVPLFLPNMGPYFYIALDVSASSTSGSEDSHWVNLYGERDIVTSDAVSLEPGSRMHNSFCLGSSVWIVSQEKKTRREIPVRGKLRVEVPYFPSREAWKKSGQWYLDSRSFLRKGGGPHDLAADIGPNWETIFVAVPCSDATCRLGCDAPPRGLPGEFRPVPDPYYLDPKWNERGRVLTDELDSNSPPCAKSEPLPQRN
jgi:hypothetical protein